MPGGDRTGPWGMGPRTGRRMGFCSGYDAPGYMNPWFGFGYGAGRGGRPWGGGGGRVFGGGRRWFGRAPYWGHPYAEPYHEPYAPPVGPYGYEPEPAEEKAMLEDQLRALQEQIKYIRDRIEELGREKKEE